MIKTKILSAVLAVAMVGGVVSDAQATSYAKTHHGHRKRVTANGRCGGVSYGTGARSCGSATGGPSGGNASKN